MKWPGNSRFRLWVSMTFPVKSISDDVLIPDNRETVIVEVVDRISVLVVESAPGAAEVQQDAFFVLAALGWIDGEAQGAQGVHVPTLVTPEQFDRTDLNEYRAVVIPNLTEMSEAVLLKLQNFAFDGGGVWIALGPRTDVERFNQYFFADANGLSPLSIDRIVDHSNSGEQKKTIDPFVASHPATASLADSARLDTGKIVVSRRFRFQTPAPGEERLGAAEPDQRRTFGNRKAGRPGASHRSSCSVKAAMERTGAVAGVRGHGAGLAELPDPTTGHSAQSFSWRSDQLAPDGNRHRCEATLRTPQGDDIELTADTNTRRSCLSYQSHDSAGGLFAGSRPVRRQNPIPRSSRSSRIKPDSFERRRAATGGRNFRAGKPHGR